MFKEKNVLKAKVKGLKDQTCVSKLNEAILKVPATINLKLIEELERL